MKKRSSVYVKYFLGVFMIASILSCGSGSDVTPTVGGTVGSPIMSQGVITKIGSATVNDVTFNSDDSTFEVEGKEGNGELSDLGVGMVVTVTGSINADGETGSATAIEFNDELEGPIDSKTNSTLIVMGQTVLTDSSTVFADTSLSALQVGDIVEVSGFRADNGVIQATRIQKKGAFQIGISEVELLGTIKDLNSSTQRFSIGGLVINYAGAFIQDSPAAGLSNGLLVEVKSTTLPVFGVLEVTRVEVKQQDFGAGEGNNAEIEGLVTRFNDVTDFDINGQKVEASNASFFGGASDDINLNVRLEAEGVFIAGTLIAEKIKFRSNRVKINATVDVGGVDISNSVVTLMGITVRINERTRLKDSTTAQADLSDLNNIHAGDALEIRGYKDGNEVLTDRLERTNAIENDKFLLQGNVESINGAVFQIMGVFIDTGNTDNDDFKEEETVIGAQEFFNRLGINSLVKARGTFDGSATTIDAKEVEIGRTMTSSAMHGISILFGLNDMNIAAN